MTTNQLVKIVKAAAQKLDVETATSIVVNVHGQGFTVTAAYEDGSSDTYSRSSPPTP